MSIVVNLKIFVEENFFMFAQGFGFQSRYWMTNLAVFLLNFVFFFLRMCLLYPKQPFLKNCFLSKYFVEESFCFYSAFLM
jgi:hypothetical protein